MLLKTTTWVFQENKNKLKNKKKKKAKEFNTRQRVLNNNFL